MPWVNVWVPNGEVGALITIFAYAGGPLPYLDGRDTVIWAGTPV